MNALVKLFGGNENDRYDILLNLDNPKELKDFTEKEATSLPSFVVQDKTTPFTGSYRGKEKWKYSGSYEVGSAFEIEVINKSNPKNATKILTSDADERKYPWSYGAGVGSGKVNAAVAYSFVNRVSVGVKSGEVPLASGVTGKFGLEADTSLVTSHIRRHDAGTPLNEAIVSDLTSGNGFLFSMNANSVLKLEPGTEFLNTTFRAGFGFSGGIRWGQVFRADAGLIGDIFPGNDALAPLGGVKVLESAKVGAELNFRIRTDWNAPLELVAYQPADERVRVEFRKASRSTTTAGIDFAVTAHLMSKENAKHALAELLRFYTGFEDADLGQITSKLNSLIERIDDKLASIQLVDFFEDKSKVVQNAIARVEEKLDKLFGVASGELIRVGEKKAELRQVIERSMKKLDLSVSVDSIVAKLSGKLTSFADDQVSDDAKLWIAAIRDVTGHSEITPVVLVQLLSVDRYRDAVSDALNAKAEWKGKHDLEGLRRELLNQMEVVFEKLDFDKDAERVLKLIRDRYDIAKADIASAFEFENIIKGFLTSSQKDRFDEIMEALDGFSVADLIDVDNWEKKLLDVLGVDLEDFRKRVDTIIDRIASAVSGTAKLTAEFEYSHKREHETLLGFTTDLSKDGARNEWKDIYQRLLFGDWEFAREKLADDSKHFYPDEEIEFFALEKNEKSTVFALNILIGEFSQKNTDSWQRTLNLEGDESWQIASALDYEGEWGWKKKKWNDNKQRMWSGHRTAYAETRGFVTPSKIGGDDFDVRISSGISWGGMTKLSGWGSDSKLNPKPGNWAMLNILADVYDANVPGGDLADTLHEIRKSLSNTDQIFIGLSLDAGADSLRPIWKAAPPVLGNWSKGYSNDTSRWVTEYRKHWFEFEQLRRGKKTFTGTKSGSKTWFSNFKMHGPEMANFGFHCRSLGLVANALRSKSTSPSQLYDAMEWWSKRSNVTGSAGLKFDKFCYFVTMVSLLPKKSEDWKLSASLRVGEEQRYFGR